MEYIVALASKRIGISMEIGNPTEDLSRPSSEFWVIHNKSSCILTIVVKFLSSKCPTSSIPIPKTNGPQPNQAKIVARIPSRAAVCGQYKLKKAATIKSSEPKSGTKHTTLHQYQSVQTPNMMSNNAVVIPVDK